MLCMMPGFSDKGRPPLIGKCMSRRKPRRHKRADRRVDRRVRDFMPGRHDSQAPLIAVIFLRIDQADPADLPLATESPFDR